MDSRSKNNSAGISLEEKFANVSSQLSNVTERLGHVEHDLDLERASREDIIKAEVERRVKEMERALEAKYEERGNARETDYEERKRKLAQQLELFMKALLEIMDGNSPDVRCIRWL